MFKSDVQRAVLGLRDGGVSAIPASQLAFTQSPHLSICVPAGIKNALLHPNTDALNNQVTVNSAANTVTLRTVAVDASALPGAVLPAFCGDLVCAASESCSQCSSDCGKCANACGAVACPVCGDHICTPVFENCVSCERDCGACPVVCGDGSCTGMHSELAS